MTYNPSRYEHSYGVHLVDDIHNFFPEFLYDAGMFPGNQIVNFLQMRVNELFPAEFTHNRTNYRLFQLDRRRREAGIPSPFMTPPRRTQPIIPTAPTRRPRHPQPVVQPTAQPVAHPVAQTYSIPLTTLFTQTDDVDTTGMNVLNTLLSTAILGTRQDLADLLTPVVVAPTEQQITAASIVSTLEPPADVTCTICQDHADPSGNDVWRILRHCSHRFHRSCIDQWFQQNVHCPVCRHDIRTP